MAEQDIYRQLAELGLIDEQTGQIDQRLAMNLQRRAQPMPQGGSPIASFGNSFAWALGQGLGALQERDLRSERKLLTKKQQDIRGKAMELSGSAPNVSGLFDPSADPAALQAQESQIAAQLAEHEKKARMLMQTGDPVLAQQGQLMMQQVQEAKGQVLAAPEKRLTRATQQQSLLKSRADFERMNGPATPEHHMLAQKYGTQIPQGATVAQAEQILEVALKGFDAANKKRQLDIDQAKVDQDAFGALPNPTGTGFLMWNKKTGEREWVADGPGGNANPLGRPTEQQKNKVANSSANARKLDMALDALEKNPGAYGGATNFVAGAIERAAPDFLTPPIQSANSMRLTQGELQAKNFVTNVVSEIIKERAGGSVTLNEELRQKFLPQETDSLEVAKQKLRDLKTWEQMTVDSLTGRQPAAALPRAQEPGRGSGTPAPLNSPDSYYE